MSPQSSFSMRPWPRHLPSFLHQRHGRHGPRPLSASPCSPLPHCSSLEYEDLPGSVRGEWREAHRGQGVFANRVAFPLQAWRKYDTDRSGYIEANELKVGWALGEGTEGVENGTGAGVVVLFGTWGRRRHWVRNLGSGRCRKTQVWLRAAE